MRDKSSDRDRKMFVARIDDPSWLGKEAKRMATALLEKEKNSLGDTIEAAAYRLQVKHGVPAKVIMQCWNREPREMKVSRWMAVFAAYWSVFEAVSDKAYENERKHHDANSALVGLADFVAGKTGQAGVERRD
jgi:hypothetical protein